MDARTFARFHLDAGIGDVVMGPLDTTSCRDWLGFAGVEAGSVRMIPREQQFAEKLHAYTLPRNTANTRVKDLVDLALLINSGGLNKRRILAAIGLTFDRRGTHPLPAHLLRRQRTGRFRFEASLKSAEFQPTFNFCSRRCICMFKTCFPAMQHEGQISIGRRCCKWIANWSRRTG